MIATIGVLVVLLLPAHRSIRPTARKVQCMSNLRCIGIALQQYHAVHGALPPACTFDSNGRPLHSWRTLILPELGHTELYESIDLTKPWDDPANAKAFETRVPEFDCPAMLPRGLTNYMAAVGPDAFLHPTRPRSFDEIQSPSVTLMLFESDMESAVHWMSPANASIDAFIQFGARSKLPHSGGINAIMGDGSARFLNQDLDPGVRRKLVSITTSGELGPGSY